MRQTATTLLKQERAHPAMRPSGGLKIEPSAVDLRDLREFGERMDRASRIAEYQRKSHVPDHNLDRQIIVYGHQTLTRQVLESGSTTTVRHKTLEGGGLWTRRKVSFGRFYQDEGVTVGLAAVDATRSLLQSVSVSPSSAFMCHLIDPTERYDSAALARTLRALEGYQVSSRQALILCINEERRRPAITLWRPWRRRHAPKWDLRTMDLNDSVSINMTLKTLAHQDQSA